MAAHNCQPSSSRIYWTAFIGLLFDYYDLYLFIYLDRVLAAEFSLTPAASNFLQFVGLAGVGAGALGFGWLADRWGRGRVMLVVFGVYAFGIGGLSLAWGYSSLVGFRLLSSAALGAEWGISHTFLAERVDRATRYRFAALLQFAILGGLLAALAKTYVLPHLGWRGLFAASIAPIACLSLVRWRALVRGDAREIGDDPGLRPRNDSVSCGLPTDVRRVWTETHPSFCRLPRSGQPDDRERHHQCVLCEGSAPGHPVHASFLAQRGAGDAARRVECAPFRGGKIAPSFLAEQEAHAGDDDAEEGHGPDAERRGEELAVAEQLEELVDGLGDRVIGLLLREHERVGDLEHGEGEGQQPAGDEVGHDQRQRDPEHGLERRAAEVLRGLLQGLARLLETRRRPSAPRRAGGGPSRR
jgi:hypothetical protein